VDVRAFINSREQSESLLNIFFQGLMHLCNLLRTLLNSSHIVSITTVVTIDTCVAHLLVDSKDGLVSKVLVFEH
jgi:hypothetical protein